MTGTLDRLPDELRTEAFERLFQACEIARFEPEVKLKYEKEMITERQKVGKKVEQKAVMKKRSVWQKHSKSKELLQVLLLPLRDYLKLR